MGSGAGLASDAAHCVDTGTSAYPRVCSLSSGTVFKARTGVGGWSCPWSNTQELCVGMCSGVQLRLCSGTLGWPLALWPPLHLSRGQCFLSPGCFLSGRLCGKHVCLGLPG